MREKATTDRERLLLAGTWRQVQEGRTAAVSKGLRAEEETKGLEERHRDHARDLESRLSSAEEKLEQLCSEQDTACTEVLGLKEGHDVALPAMV